MLAEWHGLAKLQLHMTATLALKKTLTTRLGKELCAFATLTENMDVKETPQEYARRRKQYEQQKASSMAKRQHRPAHQAAGPSQTEQTTRTSEDGRQERSLNLNTTRCMPLGIILQQSHSMEQQIRTLHRL